MIYSGHTGYLDDIPETVRKAEEDLRPFKHRFDFIAVTGMSGVLIGSPAAIRLRRPLVVLRKENDSSHSWGQDLINSDAAKGRYIILDDFIAGGSTYRRLRQRFDEGWMGDHTRYAGAYLYSERIISWDGDDVIHYDPPVDDGYVATNSPSILFESMSIGRAMAEGYSQGVSKAVADELKERLQNMTAILPPRGMSWGSSGVLSS
jgi:hypothetical protein